MQVYSQPVSYQTTNTWRVDRFNSTVCRALSIVQILLGLLCIAAGSVALILGSSTAPVAAGLWCGPFFIVTGSIGLGAARSKNKCLVIGFMVLSIVAASAFVLPVVAASAASFHEDYHSSYRYEYVAPPTTTRQPYSNETTTRHRYYSYDNYRTVFYPQGLAAKRAVNGLLISFGVIEAIIATLSAVICCSALCGCCRNQSQQYQEPAVAYMVIPQGAQFAGLGGETHHVSLGQPHAAGTVMLGMQAPLPTTQLVNPPTYSEEPLPEKSQA